MCIVIKGVRQRSDSPILIDDADVQRKQYRQSAPQLQQRGVDSFRSSPAKRVSGSMQTPIQTQSYADQKRRRVVPSPPVRNQFSTPREDVNVPLREFPARNPPATRTSSQNVRSETKTIDNTQASIVESRSLQSTSRSTVTSNEAPTTDIIAPAIADRIPVIDTSTISEEHDTKPLDPSVTDSSQEATGTPAQTSTEAVNPFADFKIVNVAGADDTSVSLELENVGSPPNDPVPTRLYQHEEFQNRSLPSTSTGQSTELEHSSSMHSDTMADASYGE